MKPSEMRDTEFYHGILIPRNKETICIIPDLPGCIFFSKIFYDGNQHTQTYYDIQTNLSIQLTNYICSLLDDGYEIPEPKLTNFVDCKTIPIGFDIKKFDPKFEIVLSITKDDMEMHIKCLKKDRVRKVRNLLQQASDFVYSAIISHNKNPYILDNPEFEKQLEEFGDQLLKFKKSL